MQLYRLSGLPSIPVLIPYIDLWELTEQALLDVIVQDGVACTPLLLDNCSALIKTVEESAEFYAFKSPYAEYLRMPGTVCKLWNAGLEVAFGAGAQVAAVVNNDVRLHPHTLSRLHACLTATDALFVSAVGVRDDTWKETPPAVVELLAAGRGGPDYSCFLITKECWERYPFDERFTYFGDNDHYTRMKFEGNGSRIFRVNVPYLHYGSRTIHRSVQAEAEAAVTFEAHRALYVKKWGGLP